jgi:hypothetical protein
MLAPIDAESGASNARPQASRPDRGTGQIGHPESLLTGLLHSARTPRASRSPLLPGVGVHRRSSAPIDLRKRRSGEGVPIDGAAQILEDHGSILMAPRHFAPQPPHEPPHGHQTHALGVDAQRVSAGAIGQRQGANGLGRLKDAHLDVVGYGTTNVRGVQQVVFKVGVSATAHAAFLGKFSLKMLPHDNDDFRFGHSRNCSLVCDLAAITNCCRLPLVTLNTGVSCTAQVSGVGGGTGGALVEFYAPPSVADSNHCVRILAGSGQQKRLRWLNTKRPRWGQCGPP